MSLLEKCCIGMMKEESCHLNSFSNIECMYRLEDMDDEDVKLLFLRLPELHNFETVCNHHYQKYIVYYSRHQVCCADPWSRHKKSVKSGLNEVTLEKYEKSKEACNLVIKPGQKICNNCHSDLSQIIKDYEEQLKWCIDPLERHKNKVETHLQFLNQEAIEFLQEKKGKKFSLKHKICSVCNRLLQTNILEVKSTLKPLGVSELVNEIESVISSSPESTSKSISDASEYETSSQQKRKLDQILNVCNVPLFKRQKLSDKRVTEKGVEIVQEIVNHVTKLFEESNSVTLPNLKELEQVSAESEWFRCIISNIQEKYKLSNSNDKISLLTLLPTDWNYKKTREYFPCSYYQYSESSRLRAEKG